jgi:hypothetical protein
VTRFRHCLSIWLCWGFSIFLIQAQALPEWLAKSGNDKAPPAFGILDESNLFNKDSGAFKRISDQLRKLELDHNYKIYLVVESVLIGSTPSELAADLRRAWIPEGNGLVIVFETDSRRLGIGQDLENHPEITNQGSRIPVNETSGMLTRAAEATDIQLAPEPYLEALINSLYTEHEDYFKRLATPTPPERSVKTGLLIVGILALLGLGAIAIGGLLRHSSMAAGLKFRFPVVDRPERLGAPCGGSATARKFGIPKTENPGSQDLR